MTDLHDLALLKLRLDGQRLTTGRQLILRALEDVSAPMTIPMILAREPRLAQSSVYRNLAVLEHAGLVSKIEMGDDHAHYELGEEVTHHHHHHMICRTCGKVTDVTLPDAVERALERTLSEVAAANGFDLEHHRLDLVGTCVGSDTCPNTPGVPLGQHRTRAASGRS